MAWPVSAETEFLGGILYRNVWQKDDPELARDAVALGTGVMGHGRGLRPEAWATNLCVAAFDDLKLVAITRATIRSSDRFHVEMAYLQMLVPPEYKKDTLVANLTTKSHEVMRLHAQSHPASRIGGTVAVLGPEERRGKSAVTESFMVLAGYTPRDEPIFVRWFDQFKLIEAPRQFQRAGTKGR